MGMPSPSALISSDLSTMHSDDVDTRTILQWALSRLTVAELVNCDSSVRSFHSFFATGTQRERLQLCPLESLVTRPEPTIVLATAQARAVAPDSPFPAPSPTGSPKPHAKTRRSQRSTAVSSKVVRRMTGAAAWRLPSMTPSPTPSLPTSRSLSPCTPSCPSPCPQPSRPTCRVESRRTRLSSQSKIPLQLSCTASCAEKVDKYDEDEESEGSADDDGRDEVVEVEEGEEGEEVVEVEEVEQGEEGEEVVEVVEVEQGEEGEVGEEVIGGGESLPSPNPALPAAPPSVTQAAAAYFRTRLGPRQGRTAFLVRAVQGFLDATSPGPEFARQIWLSRPDIFSIGEGGTSFVARLRRLYKGHCKIKKDRDEYSCADRLCYILLDHDLQQLLKSEELILSQGRGKKTAALHKQAETICTTVDAVRTDRKAGRGYRHLVKQGGPGFLIAMGSQVSTLWERRLSKSDINLILEYLETHLSELYSRIKAQDVMAAKTLLIGFTAYGWTASELAATQSDLIDQLNSYISIAEALKEDETIHVAVAGKQQEVLSGRGLKRPSISTRESDARLQRSRAESIEMQHDLAGPSPTSQASGSVGCPGTPASMHPDEQSTDWQIQSPDDGEEFPISRVLTNLELADSTAKEENHLDHLWQDFGFYSSRSNTPSLASRGPIDTSLYESNLDLDQLLDIRDYASTGSPETLLGCLGDSIESTNTSSLSDLLSFHTISPYPKTNFDKPIHENDEGLFNTVLLSPGGHASLTETPNRPGNAATISLPSQRDPEGSFPPGASDSPSSYNLFQSPDADLELSCPWYFSPPIVAEYPFINMQNSSIAAELSKEKEDEIYNYDTFDETWL